MRLRNRDGTPIDPVPFLVVALLSIMILVGWGPLYLMAHGASLQLSVAISVVLACVAVCLSFYWFVWTTNPTVRQEVPAATRYLRLLYGLVIGILVLLALVVLLYI